MENYYSLITETAIEYRGKIIHEACYLEKMIDTYIAMYFCEENPLKISDMQLLILGDNRMNFESKRQIFDFISKNYDQNWYYQYKNISKDLQDIIEHRNVLAHCLLDTSEDSKNFQEGVIRFIRFKNNVDYKVYTVDTLFDLWDKIGKCIKHLGIKVYDPPLPATPLLNN